MRILTLAAPAAFVLGLAACAPTTMGGGGGNSYSAQLDRLTEECRERGGILAPTGQQSGRPQSDNVCRITGQPSSRVGG